MTAPHDSAANAENNLASGGVGLFELVGRELLEGDDFARGRNDATTLEQT